MEFCVYRGVQKVRMLREGIFPNAFIALFLVETEIQQAEENGSCIHWAGVL